MADTLITGTTLVEKESRSIGDIAIGGIIEWDDSISGVPNLPEGFLECDGSTIVDALSPINGQTIPNLNTNYATISGIAFKGKEVQENVRYPDGTCNTSSAAEIMVGSIQLPHGAIITAALGRSNSVGETWTFNRVNLDSTKQEIATAASQTESTSISFAEVDNKNYGYYFEISGTIGQIMDAAKVTYTPRNKFIIRIR